MAGFDDCCMGTSETCLKNGVCDWLAEQLAPSENRVSYDAPSEAMHQSLMMKGADEELRLVITWMLGQAAGWRLAGDSRMEMLLNMLAADLNQHAHRE